MPLAQVRLAPLDARQKLGLQFGPLFQVLGQPVLETGGNKLSFQAAAAEQLIEAEELIAQER